MPRRDLRKSVLVKFIAPWRRYVHAHPWAHAFMATFLLASLTVLVEDPFLEWLDVAMLRIVPEFEATSVLAAPLQKLGWSPSFSPADPKKPLNVLVLTIEQPYFDKEFAGRTPIPRKEFLALLKRIKEVFFERRLPEGVRSPVVLAIDYDLSPNAKAPADNRQWQKPLSDFLAEFARSKTADGKRRTVLLIRHLDDFDEESCQGRLNWEASMQDLGVRFGRPELVHHALFDSVAKYKKDDPLHFAAQLKSAALDQSTREFEQFRCRTAEDAKEDREPDARELQPINFLGAIENVRVCPLESIDDVEELCARFLGWGGSSGAEHPRFDAVVVGAGYDQRDIFLTPLGQRSGAALHAYIGYSISAPLSTNRGRAFLWDLAIGMSAAFILVVIWHRGDERGSRKRPLYFPILGVGVVTVYSLSLLSCAPLLMQSGIWLNPGPMIIALFIDFWLHVIHTVESETHGPRSWWTIWGYVSWLSFFLTALAYVIFDLELRWWAPFALWLLVSFGVYMYALVHPNEFAEHARA